MEVKLNNGFGFIIDTDEYSGNFERELCAHVTGRVGECEVGGEFVEDNIQDKFDNVIDVEDEGCARPCSIFPTKGYYNNGSGGVFLESGFETGIKHPAYQSVIIYFSSKPTEEQISLMKERSYTFNETSNKLNSHKSYHKDADIVILGFRLLEVKQVITEIEVLKYD